MRIGFVVNRVATELPAYTTTRLALAAQKRGHEVWLIGVEDFSHQPDGPITARGRGTAGKKPKTTEAFLAACQAETQVQPISVDELDVVMMRNDPSADATERPWAIASGILFGQLAVARGVLVVNDPASLALAINKTYFQHFPETVRPLTLISRDHGEITEFIEQLGGQAVLKPLQGSGGSGVFLVSTDEAPNLNQIIEAISRDGYVVAQEFLPAAKQGDVRIFVMNGRVLERDGARAAFRRVSKTSDLRSNMHAGGEAEPVEVTDEMLGVIEAVRPKLIEDGMFLVGLDLVGGKLMEANVFSPGGLGSMAEFYGVSFAEVVIEDLERKLEIRRQYGDRIPNHRLATL